MEGDILNFKDRKCKYSCGTNTSWGHDCNHKSNENYRNACDTRNCPRLKGLNTYKCWECGHIGNEGDTFYQVKIVSAHGELLFVPTCSDECAIKTKDKNYQLHISRAEEISHCSVQKMKWE